jgi:6-pyruvoyltetrahydropterin/6-carboxytetrahydropterin synthase
MSAARSFEILREIGIDAGHRVPHHGSKCKNLHGHRYRVQAICSGVLHASGEQQGMVLEDEMMAEIDAPCDNGTVLWLGDPLLPEVEKGGLLGTSIAELTARAEGPGFVLTEWFAGKLYLIAAVPTAENHAEHWYRRLAPRVAARSAGQATLEAIRVWETPNCSAEYRSGPV